MLPLETPAENICIVKLSALGDVSHAVPVLRAIQRAWPQSRVTWICARLEHRLLQRMEGVRFVVVDKKAGPGGYLQLRRELAGERFDAMLQMQTSSRANLTGALVSADIKLGWDEARAREFHRFFMTHSIPAAPFEHQVQAHLSFARTLGLEAAEPVWNFPVGEKEAEFAATVMPEGRRTLLLSPCSSHPARSWQAERYAAVADYAIDELGMSVVLSGGPARAELALGEAIEAAMNNPAKNLIGKDTLQELLALVQRADIVLSPDSGPAHLANAMGTPVVALHASTWSRRSGPYHSLHLCVDKFAEAAQRFRGKQPEQLRWGTRIEDPGVMDLIEVDDVIERLDAAFEQVEASPA
jgi:heptosyltransferase I